MMSRRRFAAGLAAGAAGMALGRDVAERPQIMQTADATTLVNPFLHAPAEQYFFDAFARPADAFSLRDLSGTDPTVVNVRRSSDSATNTFTTSEITDGTLVSWVGAGNDGEVRDWYNQGTGSVRFTTESWANGPLIVDNGSLVTRNSNPSMYFDGVYDSFMIASDGLNAVARPYGVFFVVAPGAATSNTHFFDHYDDRFIVTNALGFFDFYNGSGAGLNTHPFHPTDDTLYSPAVIIEAASGQYWVDGIDRTNGGSVGPNDLGDGTSRASLAGDRWGGTNAKCWYSELIVLSEADYATLLTDIGTIQGNQNTYWGTG